MDTIYRDIVAALIKSKDGKILMVKKNPHGGGVYINVWHIPGGGVEEGETLETAVAREVFEEVGLQYTSQDYRLVDDKGSGESEKITAEGKKVQCKMKFFVLEINIDSIAEDIPVSLSDELSEFKWFTHSQIQINDITPPSQTLFQRLGLLS